MCWQGHWNIAWNDRKNRAIARETQMPHRKQKWHYQHWKWHQIFPESVAVAITCQRNGERQRPFTMRVSFTFSAKRLQYRGIDLCKMSNMSGVGVLRPRKARRVFWQKQHVVVNETIRYNAKLIHVDLDCSCLFLSKLLHPFISANGYPCDTQPHRGDACIHAW